MIVTGTMSSRLERTFAVPQLEYDDVLRASSVHFDCGGKGFYVSRSLYVTGMESVAMGNEPIADLVRDRRRQLLERDWA